MSGQRFFSLLPQVWIIGAPGVTLCPDVETHDRPLVELEDGAPPVHIISVRIVGRVKVSGGELVLTNCTIEPRSGWGSSGSGRRLAASRERALLVDGGRVVLTRTVLRGHDAGAIGVHTASFIMIESTVQECRAPSGGGLLVGAGAEVLIEQSNFTNNTATVTGGAIQVREQPSCSLM